jgi:hypothetical protein
MVCVWPLAVRSRFVSLIEQRHPFALTLLAFYCAQLHIFRHYWFVERRAETLLSEILTIMPPGYADLLEWPRRFCSSGPGLGGWGVVHLAAEGMSPSMWLCRSSSMWMYLLNVRWRESHNRDTAGSDTNSIDLTSLTLQLAVEIGYEQVNGGEWGV